MAIMPRAGCAVARTDRPISPQDPATWDHLTPCAVGHHLLYRLYNEAGDLLYVGVTWTPRERWRRHSRKTHWWPSVASVVVECHPSERVALRHELDAIKAEAPLHNKRGAAA